MIKKLIDKPIAVTMSLVALVVLSITAMGLIPVSIAPDVDIPKITVNVSSVNMTARQLEDVAVKPLRNQLMQTNNITNLYAETKDGSSNIYMSFEYGTDIDFAFMEVNEKIDKSMNNLPRDIARPHAIKANATDIPAFYINVKLKTPDANFKKSDLYPVSPKFVELTEFVRQVLIKRIEQLPEVAVVDVSGYVMSEILIIPNNEKLKSLNITVDRLERAINENNLSLGNVSIRDGEYHYNVRFDSKISTKEDIENIYLNIENKLFKIKDIAEVYHHPQKMAGIVESDGQSAVTMAIIKNYDSQMADLKESIYKSIEIFEKDYPEISLTVTRDQTSLLDYLIGNLINNILIGALLACVVLFLFIHDLKTPFLIIISIPISLIISMLAFYVFGVTINIISLSGLVLGIGMMVDNSIIVIDNITQRWERGEPLKQAAEKGASEVFPAMLSSVLTTCSVFIPLIFISGISGALFFDQAASITITLFSSLIVAILVIPVYYVFFFRNSKSRTTNKFLKKISFINHHAIYESGIIWLMRRQWIVAVSYIVFIVVGIFIFQALKKENLPYVTETDTILTVDWNDRISVEDNQQRVQKLNAIYKDEASQITSIIGNNQFMLSHTPSGSIQSAVIYIKTESPEQIEGVKSKAKDYLSKNYSNISYSFDSSGDIFDMIFSENESALTANIRTTNGLPPNPNELDEIVASLRKQLPDVQLNPIAYSEQIELIVRPDMLSLYGIEQSQLIASLKNAFGNNKLFAISQGQSSVDIVIGERNTTLEELLRNTYITKDNNQFPITTFLKETKSKDFKVIVSDAGGDYYPINMNISDKKIIDAMEQIKDIVRVNPNYDVTFTGSYFSSREMISELSVILLVSILLLFFILATQFESLLQPFVILSEIIIDLVGAFLALWLCGASLNLMSMIGIIVMCGIVINDSILKIDTINRLRAEGYGLIRAVLTGGLRRLTPIIMTSLTTILAVAPFLVRGDLGSDLQFPLSVALIGGMIMGTLVSIFFVPIIYYQIYKKR